MRLFVALMALAPPCILLHFAAFEPLLVHLVLLVCFSKEMGRGDGATVGNGAAGTGGGPVIRDRNKQAVISEKLIFECVYVQPTHAADDDRSKGVAAAALLGGGVRGGAASAGQDGRSPVVQTVELHEITALMFCYKSIAKIDNLVGVENLTRLYLDNNQLTTIENLGHLRHLRWLDLSFNHITAIQNLETLVDLEDLSLYSNEISAISGLDTLVNLRCLSLGKNKIESLDEVTQKLHKLKSLRMLTLAGNKIESQAQYKSRLLGHIPRLRYLDGRLIFAHEVEKAREDQKEHLLSQDEQDKKEEQEMQRAKAAAEVAAEYLRANVPNEIEFAEEIYNLEPEGRSIRALLESDTLKEKAKDVVEPHKERFKAKAEEMAAKMKDIRKRKDADAADFDQTLARAKQATDEECKSLIKSFERKLKKLIPFGLRVKADVEAATDVTIAELREELATLKQQLLEKEADEMDAHESVIAAYEDHSLQVKSEAQEVLGSHFEELRMLERQFHLDIKTKFDLWYDDRQKQQQEGAEGFSGTGASDHRDKQLLQLLDNKDEYSKALSDWSDLHVKRLDEREEVHKKKEEEEAKELIARSIAHEHERNRLRICEIHAYSERMKEYMTQWEQGTGE